MRPCDLRLHVVRGQDLCDEILCRTIRRIAIQLRTPRSPRIFEDIEDVAIKPRNFLGIMAGTTGLEPATSAVTGQRSNQLSYVPRYASRKWLRWRSALQR